MTLLVGCKNDDDLIPRVDVNINLENVAQDGNTLYVVADPDTPLVIQSVGVTPIDGGNAGLSIVSYYVNGLYAETMSAAPYSIAFDVQSFAEGVNEIGLDTSILQVDKEIFRTQIYFNVVAVASVDDLPDGVTLGTTTLTYRVDPK